MRDALCISLCVRVCYTTRRDGLATDILPRFTTCVRRKHGRRGSYVPFLFTTARFYPPRPAFEVRGLYYYYYYYYYYHGGIIREAFGYDALCVPSPVMMIHVWIFAAVKSSSNGNINFLTLPPSLDRVDGGIKSTRRSMCTWLASGSGFLDVTRPTGNACET